jgi:choline-sulfatase
MPRNSVNRRDFLKLAGVAAALPGCSGGGSSGSHVVPSPNQPNILQIVIDDLNDWVGFLGGHPQVQTPHMDALAARSTVLEHAYCTAPVCSASRAGALSGLSVQSTGVGDLSQTFKSVNPGKREFDEMLAGAGYKMKRYGKVDHEYTTSSHFHQPLPAVTPASNKQCAPANDEGAFDWAPMLEDDSEFPDYKYAQQGIDFLAAQPVDQAFCLSVGLVRTHVAWYVPKRFFDMYPAQGIIVPNVPANDLTDIGPVGQSYALKFNFYQCITGQSLWSDAVRAYLASISWVDEQVGRLMAALDASPHAANTMVVLWSDNAFHLGEKFHWHKQTLWERSTRVPFMIRLPAQTTGVRQSTCVSLRDLAPSVLDACHVSGDYPMDGTSLLPLLANPTMAWERPVLMSLDGIHHAVRTNQWRYIRYNTGEQELYDEVNDPDEFVNLAGLPQHNTLIAQLDALLPAIKVS